MHAIEMKDALANKTVVELRQKCRDDGIIKHSGKNKPELIEHMMAHYHHSTQILAVSKTDSDSQQIRCEPDRLSYGLTDENIGVIRKMARFEKEFVNTGKRPEQERYYGRIITGSYWDGKGCHQKLYDALFEILVPPVGECQFEFGEPLRMLSKICSDYYNNGWGNLPHCYVDYIESVLDWTKTNDYPGNAFVWFLKDVVEYKRSQRSRDCDSEDEDDNPICQWDKEDDPSFFRLMDAVVKWTASAVLNHADQQVAAQLGNKTEAHLDTPCRTPA